MKKFRYIINYILVIFMPHIKWKVNKKSLSLRSVSSICNIFYRSMILQSIYYIKTRLRKSQRTHNFFVLFKSFILVFINPRIEFLEQLSVVSSWISSFLLPLNRLSLRDRNFSTDLLPYVHKPSRSIQYKFSYHSRWWNCVRWKCLEANVFIRLRERDKREAAKRQQFSYSSLGEPRSALSSTQTVIKRSFRTVFG